MKLNAGAKLGNSFVERAHGHSQAGGFKKTGERGRKQTPILTEFCEPWKRAQFVIQTHVGHPKVKLAGADAADVAVVDIRVVAFEVRLYFRCKYEARIFRHPFELAADPEAPSLDVELRIRSRTGIAAYQQGKRPILIAKGGATAGRGIFDGAGLEEAIYIHVGSATEVNIRNDPTLLRHVNGQNPDWRNCRNSNRFCRKRRSTGRSLTGLSWALGLQYGVRQTDAGWFQATGVTVAVYSCELIRPFSTSN